MVAGPDFAGRDFADVQAHWARLLLVSLADAGVEEVVISPGSRSTPFVHAAASSGALRTHDVADERSAAFFALGRARVTGRPALLLCTSGSAGAHYLPAVAEAAADRLPLLILTADRPPELHDAGANQTFDQQKLFGDHVRAFHELGLADDDPRALRALRRRAAQAVFQARWPVPGPVHLNARARKPLEPAAGTSDLARRVDALLERPVPRPAAGRLEPSDAELATLAESLRSAERGVVVCGPPVGTTPEEARRLRALLEELVRRLGWPLLADTAGGLRGDAAVHAPGVLLGTKAFVGEHRPDLVLQVGRAPTATSWLGAIVRWTEDGSGHRVVSRHGWQDPESTASHLLFADPERVLERLLELVEAPDPSLPASEWLAGWRSASDSARRIAEKIAGADADDRLDEASAVRRAVEGVPPGGRLILGNSLPVRMADFFAPPPPGAVLHQRGLSGIDGLVAGAVGAALDGEPTLLLLGDVSLRHDAGSLALARRAPRLVIVLIDNGGGRIFDQLPAADHPATSGAFVHWIQGGSPGWASLARAHGLRHRRPKSASELSADLDAAFVRGGAWLVEARVPPTSAREALDELRRRFDAEWKTKTERKEASP